MVAIDLSGKVSIITGAAAGLGKAICDKLGKAGSTVVIADINEEMGENTLKEMKRKGYTADFIKTDVSDVKSVKKMVEEVIKKYEKQLNKELAKNKSYDGYTALTVENVAEEIEKSNTEEFEPDVLIVNTLIDMFDESLRSDITQLINDSVIFEEDDL